MGFHFEYPTRRYEVVTEGYVYMFEDLIADVGGYLV